MNSNQFPVEAFNDEVKNFIIELSSSRYIDVGIVSSAVLNACGFVLSDGYELSVMNGWKERSNLWTIISIKSGMGKSVVERHIFKPILEFQKTLIDKHSANNRIYNEWVLLLKSLKIKLVGDYLDENPELRNWLHNHNLNGPPVEEKLLNIFSDDFTFEKLFQMLMDNNGHSFLIRGDEISGVFKMFNKYRMGNDEESLLKLWGYDVLKSNKVKEEGNVFIENPTVSIFGATQPELLFDIFTQQRKVNGNLYRFLFSLDDSKITHKNVFSLESNSFDNEIVSDFLKYHVKFFYGVKSITNLVLNNECNKFLHEWRENMVHQYVTNNLVDINTYNSIMGKMDSYIFRIAIILNRLRLHFNNQESNEISVCDLENSAKIVDYYIKETINILSLTDLSYRKFFKNKDELFFYENKLQASAPYFEVVKQIEIDLGVGVTKANNLLNKWTEYGILKRNSKGLIYKVINKV